MKQSSMQPASAGIAGITTSNTFDSSGRISIVTVVVGGVSTTYTYTYDTMNRVATMAYNNGTYTTTSTYSYDAQSGRLTGVTVA